MCAIVDSCGASEVVEVTAVGCSDLLLLVAQWLEAAPLLISLPLLLLADLLEALLRHS